MRLDTLRLSDNVLDLANVPCDCLTVIQKEVPHFVFTQTTAITLLAITVGTALLCFSVLSFAMYLNSKGR